jgi:hypothetical protein
LDKSQHSEDWLWPDLPALRDLEGTAPRILTMTDERQEWAKQKLEEVIAERVEPLQAASMAKMPQKPTFAKRAVTCSIVFIWMKTRPARGTLLALPFA